MNLHESIKKFMLNQLGNNYFFFFSFLVLLTNIHFHKWHDNHGFSFPKWAHIFSVQNPDFDIHFTWQLLPSAVIIMYTYFSGLLKDWQFIEDISLEWLMGRHRNRQIILLHNCWYQPILKRRWKNILLYLLLANSCKLLYTKISSRKLFNNYTDWSMFIQNLLNPVCQCWISIYKLEMSTQSEFSRYSKSLRTH